MPNFLSLLPPHDFLGLPAALALAFVSVLGGLIGSFLNVVVHRVPREESIVFPNSRCPACGAGIRFYDNVPVLSWLALRGRCRDCSTHISARYPAVELLTAVLFGLTFWFRSGLTIRTFNTAGRIFAEAVGDREGGRRRCSNRTLATRGRRRGFWRFPTSNTPRPPSSTV